MVFWQKCNYSLRKFIHHLWWDFELSHRGTFETVTKVVIGILAGTFLVFGRFDLAGLTALLGFGFIVNEVISHLQKLYWQRWPKLQPDWRVPWVYSSVITILLITAGLIGWGWLVLISEAGSGIILETLVPGLVFLLLAGLVFDLASSFITLILLTLAAPFQGLLDSYYIAKAAQKIKRMPELKVVFIAGSQGKTAIRKLLHNVLADNYRVLANIEHAATPAIAARMVLDNLRPTTKVLILELNVFRNGDIAKFARIARPHIGLITGIDEAQIGLFGGVDQALFAYGSLLDRIAPRGVAILNASDTNVRRLIQTHRNNEVLYYPDENSQPIIDNDPLVEQFRIKKVNDISETRSKITIEMRSHTFAAEFPTSKIEFLPSWLAALAICDQLNLDTQASAAKLSLFTNILFPFQEYHGDHGTFILHHSANTTFSNFVQSIQYVNKVKAPGKILITGGIKSFGKYKLSTYKKLGRMINDNFDTLITVDPYLAATSAEENTRCDIVLVSNTSQLLYELRARIEVGDLILVHGDISLEVIDELRRN